MRTALKSYTSLLDRARNAVHDLRRRRNRPRSKMEFLDLELFQVDIRL
ncbi:hypothetical protein [Azospirillum rugosum]|uniref:Uncharacterized protein n=1 Tax=Azospirillum rugosum TaxID=416170 RepID=A0ABS4SWK9_9PROT|nr:hypothetical protein [Azospirillum rugosum]MBP2296940.1 hypothetical protein [Azospirillum rugosum]MDQ0530699.1 hypothetical protein [Azospirillum rugosum]